MTRRTGIPSLIDAANELCRLLTKFAPLITALYGSDPAVTAALAAAQAACSALVDALQPHRDVETF